MLLLYIYKYIYTIFFYLHDSIINKINIKKIIIDQVRLNIQIDKNI